MENLTFANIAAFFILFFGLCCFVFFAIAVYNIYRKSYRPQETVLVIITLILLFMINSVFLMLSVSRVIEGVSQGLERGPSTKPSDSSESLF
jgi:uncharacterized protein with PQ loop repeat